MSIFAYQIFDAVAMRQSFQRAAEVLNLTPSAVSHSISSLEARLGFQLFLRSRTGVTLTQEGAAILEHVRAILGGEERLQQQAAQISGAEKGTVILGTFSSICANWIPDIVKSFHSLYPNIEINIMQGDYEDVVTWTKMGVVSIGFATLPAGGDLVETPLYDDRLLCVAPRDFKPLNPEYVTAEDIDEQPFVLQGDGYNKETMSFIKKHNISIRPRFFIDDDQSIIAIVESGLGISIVPELILKKIKYDVSVYPIMPNEFRTIGLVTHKKQSLSPPAQIMHDHIVSFIKDNTR